MLERDEQKGPAPGGPLTVRGATRWAEERFRHRDLPSPRLDAEVLLAAALGVDRPALLRDAERRLTENEMKDFTGRVERRVTGEPVAYIRGRKEFWSLEFDVDPGVLIPRPDTETLVEACLDVAKDFSSPAPRILEIGTGSGAVGVALATELPACRLVATDISAEALRTARANARRNGAAGRIAFLRCNLLEPFSSLFDMIVSNPPYLSEREYRNLPEGVRRFEPKEALLAGPGGTEVQEAIIAGALRQLRHSGWVLLEIGFGQQESIRSALEGAGGFDAIRFWKDLAGVVRVAGARRRIRERG